jgi:hypothetical protein
MVNVICVRRNRQRAVVVGGGDSRGDRQAGAKVVPGRLRVSGTERIVILDPRNVDGVKEGRGQKADRGKTDCDPDFAVAFEKRLA